MNCLLNKRKGMGNRSRIWRTSIRFNTRVKSPIIIEDLRTLSFCYCCWSRDRTVGLCESHKCSSRRRAQSAFHCQCQLLRFGVVKGCQCIIWCNSKRGWDCRRAGSWDNFREVRNPWGRLHLPMLNMWGRLAERGAWELKLYKSTGINYLDFGNLNLSRLLIQAQNQQQGGTMNYFSVIRKRCFNEWV